MEKKIEKLNLAANQKEIISQEELKKEYENVLKGTIESISETDVVFNSEGKIYNLPFVEFECSIEELKELGKDEILVAFDSSNSKNKKPKKPKFYYATKKTIARRFKDY